MRFEVSVDLRVVRFHSSLPFVPHDIGVSSVDISQRVRVVACGCASQERGQDCESRVEHRELHHDNTLSVYRQNLARPLIVGNNEDRTSLVYDSIRASLVSQNSKPEDAHAYITNTSERSREVPRKRIRSACRRIYFRDFLPSLLALPARIGTSRRAELPVTVNGESTKVGGTVR